MAEKIQIVIEATDKVTGPLKTASKSVDTLADRVTRAGGDFSNLESEMADFIKTTRASTEANAKFAASYQKIEDEFIEGKLTSQQAAEAMEKLQKEMRETAAAADKADEKTGGLNMAFTELASKISIAKQAISTVVNALKQVWAVAVEGAQMEFTIKKFDRLATSVGTVSSALLNDLKKATRGTFSDMELAASATDFLTLGLAKSHDEVVRLSRVSSALGMDMNQLVLTLTNQTTMRFDALGISVDGFDEKVDALKKSGLDANAAFSEAFLQQAEAQIKRVGDVADTNAGQIMQMEAAAKNMADAFKLALAPAAGDAAVAITEFLTAVDKANDSFKQASGALEDDNHHYRMYTRLLAQAAVETGKFTTEGLGNLVMGLRKTSGAYGENRISLRQLNNMTTDQIISLAEHEGWLSTLITTMGGVSETAYGMRKAVDMQETLRSTTGAVKELAQEIGNVDITTFTASETLAEYTKELLFNKAAADLDEAAARMLARSMGVMNEETFAVLSVMEELRRKYDSNKDGAIDAAEAASGYGRDIADLTLKIDQMHSKNITVTVDNINTYQNVYYEDDYRGDNRFGGSQDDFASGANFVVPPGYPNDSYGPIYVESGEHVKITPANEVAKDMRTFNFNYSGNASAQQIRQSYEMARLLG